MRSLTEITLDHLAAMIGFDSNIDASGLIPYLEEQLKGFECTRTDHCNGSVALLAVRGRPEFVFNFHVDTVPASDDWRQDPFSLAVDGERATGLGACDIKGAAAAMLAASAVTDGDLALLFTSDEEAGAGECVPAFLETQHGFEHVVVAEPTRCQAVLAHRGIATATIEFKGAAGHASDCDRLQESAVHRAVRWASQCLDYAAGRRSDVFDALSGMPLNIGRIEGGIKPNMVAPNAMVRLGIRPLPMCDGREVLETLHGFAEPGTIQRFGIDFLGPSLPQHGDDVRVAANFADRLGLSAGSAVDFWTEAALFAATGMTAIVFGPGDIAQAHTANEWVDVRQLEQAAHAYVNIIGNKETACA
jgi:acetylornithine deacetylase